MSPPVQRPGDGKRFGFSLFYTTAHVFALISALLYWTVLVPHGEGYSLASAALPAGLLKNLDASLQSFWVANLSGVPVLIVLVEVMYLNSVKRQVPVPGHVLGLVAFLGAYLGWAAIGKEVTGHTSYFFLDPDVVGRRSRIALYSAGFAALGPVVFAVLYGLVGLREWATHRRYNRA